jgi:glyoxylase-like metal-dependent hydrolase (beta-lactamase superfamily II)
MYSMTEFITRHEDILSIVTVIDDPIYMDEPYVHSTTYAYDPTASVAHEVCNSSAFAENGGTDRHWVPHFLPGENNARNEWLKDETWFPPEAALGGVKTVYPEYRTTLNGASRVESLRVPASRSALAIDKRIADQSPKDGLVHVLPVQGNIYMLVADGTNIAVSVGPEGVLLVNTGAPQMADKVLAAINQLANDTVTPPAPNTCFGVSCAGAWGWSSPYMNAVISSPAPAKPVRYIINTSATPEHVGGNEKIATAGFFPRVQGFGAAVASVGRGASIVAHENVLNRMVAGSKQTPVPAAAQPTDTYFDELHKLPAYFNGEGVVVYHASAANTDGDSLVMFRRSEVIAAGDILSTVSYPLIDVARGGTVQGVIDGLNKIIDLAVPEYRSQGGTWIIPGRGRLSDSADVASYRNMVTMIRDRIKDLKSKGMTVQQVKAARPTLDFDGRYGATSGAWTTDMFVEAVYRTLQEKK